ncbi:hypothetical protein C8R30_11459 [Nitrosomonas nitrosa]|jgi:hypothetical protein|uniref:Uncharacterized protein n=1 Tax=Nitrosomonas nitrosa TaxID=52442 RepID=A0A1I4QBV1_9PROT|nr:hypothetical protein C8R30_11459 [Nitrosomonas nitrosa]SFM37195.1 hypothetical protein SAMN05421880_11453 [Nitrosomonas nitrosa]
MSIGKVKRQIDGFLDNLYKIIVQTNNATERAYGFTKAASSDHY